MPKRTPAIAQQIKTARKAAGLSQHKLGVVIGTTGQTVWTWEDGRQLPSAGWLQKLAAVLNFLFTIGD
jgi:DNA-binding transcriptional regulator YiaG